MKTIVSFCCCALIMFLSIDLLGQANPETAVGHLDYLSNLESQLSKKYMSYMSEVAHGEKARRMEKRRDDVINSIKIAIREGGKLRPFNGDASLRDAYKNYWNVALSIFSEDYTKIVDMEEVAERSYDAMEAYLLIQEKAGEKLDSEQDKLREVFEKFAANNNIRITEGQTSKLSRKINQTGKVNKYMNQIYLISFKSSVQETMMINAFNGNDINGIEQARSSMLKYADEGLAKLDTMKSFNGDGSMITACRKVLEFRKNEGQNKFGTLVEFLIKKEEFEKIKKSLDAKPERARTEQDIAAYNNALTSYNKLVNDYNKTNNGLNAERDKVNGNFEISRKTFVGRHTPHA
jgi:hypothetical protein